MPPIAAERINCTIIRLTFAIYQLACPQYPRRCSKFLRDSFPLEYTCTRPGTAPRAPPGWQFGSI
ncbi:hypothetical protein ACVJMY_006792 [Bradyrhizobium diazoefficiens]